MPVRALILRAPGTNCDEETVAAFELAGAEAQRLHVNRLLEQPSLVRKVEILCIPGGFSYGDDIAAGRIFAERLGELSAVLREFHDAGGLVLGICNGFQVLLKTGLLLPDGAQAPQATLTWNDSGKFEDRWVRLAVTTTVCPFLERLKQLELPVAHAEGKFVAEDETAMAALEDAGQIALKYGRRDTACAGADALASADQPGYPDNPNGSQRNVAGMCDATGRVLGLMPHPERFVTATQHPQWTRRNSASQAGDGLAIFQNAVRFFR